MRKIIFSITTALLIVASVSIGSRIQANSSPTRASIAATLAPQDFMAKLGNNLAVEKWEPAF
jgi:hypothetical protein